MNKTYVPKVANEDELEKSIFLAGPTPRSQKVKSWRSEFVNLLEVNGFDGTILIPENEDGIYKQDYLDQVEWEFEHLSKATAIVFWVPRDLYDLPGFTTNVEFGYWIRDNNDRVFYGRPPGASKTRYLDWMYKKITGHEPCSTMQSLIDEVLYWLGDVEKFNRSTMPYSMKE